MLSMLIVEDERWEREGLVELWDWSELGIVIAGTAVDGVDGYEKALQLQPDIIITDIRMPGSNGLEMSKRIRETLPDAGIIVLTGYSDFHYTREAITLNANDYVLKPLEEDSLRVSVLRVADDCRQLKNQRARERRLQAGGRLAAEKLLLDLLEERGDRDNVLAELLALDPLFAAPRYVVSIAVPSEHEDLAKLKSRLPASCYVVPCGKNPVRWALVLPLQVNADLWDPASLLSGSGNPPRVIVVSGEPAAGLERLGEAYREALETAEHSILYGQWGIVKPSSFMEETLRWRDAISQFRTEWGELCQKLRQHILSLREREAHDTVEMMFGLLRRHSGADKAYITMVFNGLLNELALLEDGRLREEGVAATGRMDGKSLYEIESLDELHSLLTKYISALIQRLDRKRNRKDDYIVERAVKLIEETYGSAKLSLSMLSGELFLSSNHLGVVFKKATGITVHQYIMDVRMRKAEELLRQTKRKVSDIAGHIGMSNQSYFCTLFKQKHGMTPGEYQELMQRR
ncbi:response regulator [Paenibacillus sp. CAU 1782]